jgi:prevent-host-death family protein
MRSVTIKEAKATLNELVEAAERGEEVVLLRGSQHVAAIVPITEADLELVPRLTDAQARRLWRQLADERDAGTLAVFEGAAPAVEHLRAPRRSRTERRKRSRG